MQICCSCWGSQICAGCWRNCCCPAQVYYLITPAFNVRKQTALLSELARIFPRLAFGVGPEQARVAAVIDDATVGEATVYVITASDGDPRAFAQARSPCGTLNLSCGVPLRSLRMRDPCDSTCPA